MSLFSGAAAATVASAETGIKFARDETQVGTTAPIPKPNAAGTNYSWPKELALEVTTVDAATSISNRKLNAASAPAAGLTLWYRNDAATYQRPTAVAAADNATTNDATPSGFTAMPTAATVYDAAAVAASALGRNGSYLSVALGVSALFLGGAGPNIALPSLSFVYDES